MQILELTERVHIGGSGRTVGAILRVLTERGYGAPTIRGALKRLASKEKCITVRNVRGMRSGMIHPDSVISVTPRGRDRLRHLRETVHVNFKLRRLIADRLAEFAGRRALSATEAATLFIDEGLRRERFPGIDFRWTRTGRQPFITGTGLTAWEMFLIWNDHGRDSRKVRENYPHLTLEQINMGVSYALEHLNEMPGAPSSPPFARPFRA